MALLWAELLVLQTIIGYCFVIANVSIGLYNIRDLNNMKGDILFVKWHKHFGRIETFFYFVISLQCILMVVIPKGFDPFFQIESYNTGTVFGIHNMIGGIVSFILFMTKIIIAFFKKNTIYRYGQIFGPIGFIGWSFGFWTALTVYYEGILRMTTEIPSNIAPTDFWVAGFLPFPIGLCMFMILLTRHGTNARQSRFSVHQIAFILHGITFGYERAARDLLGAPALFKYVVPKTYVFLERMMGTLGLDMKKLEKMNVTEAMEEFMQKASEIKMAEKIKVKWESDHVFTVESINCSTSKVRSVMSKEELTNAICPWAIIAATIVGKITGKTLDIEPSEFNEIGAKTKLTLKLDDHPNS
jgi:hypothetical protein